MKSILILLTTLFALNCHLGFIQTNHTDRAIQIPQSKSGTKLIILTEGRYCTYNFQDWEIQEANNKKKDLVCPENFLTEQGSYPLDLLLNRKGSITSWNHGHLTGIKTLFGTKEPSTGDIFGSLLSGDLIRNAIVPRDNEGGNQLSDLGYAIQKFPSYDSWKEIESQKLKDTVYLTLKAPETNKHWSSTVSLFTIAIIPGYFDTTYKSKMEYVDKKGKSTVYESVNPVVVRSWSHILFTWWSHIPYHLTLNKAKRYSYEETLQEVPKIIPTKN